MWRTIFMMVANKADKCTFLLSFWYGTKPFKSKFNMLNLNEEFWFAL